MQNIATSENPPPTKSKFSFSEDDTKTAHWIFGLLQKLNPNIKFPNFDNWANEVRLMRKVDGRSHREICELFKWANQDTFWQSNILSPKKLREKWDQLTMKRQAQGETFAKNKPKFDDSDDTCLSGMTINVGGQEWVPHAQNVVQLVE